MGGWLRLLVRSLIVVLLVSPAVAEDRAKEEAERAKEARKTPAPRASQQTPPVRWDQPINSHLPPPVVRPQSISPYEFRRANERPPAAPPLRPNWPMNAGPGHALPLVPLPLPEAGHDGGIMPEAPLPNREAGPVAGAPQVSSALPDWYLSQQVPVPPMGDDPLASPTPPVAPQATSTGPIPRTPYPPPVGPTRSVLMYGPYLHWNWWY